MPRLVIVSNRLTELSAGGLAVALSDVARQDEVLWVGWNGTVQLDPELTVNGNRVSFSLNESEHTGYYLGYANTVLWPVLHNRLDLARFDAGLFPVYQSVNQRVAALLAPMLECDDEIWVHDYHFMLLAAELRKLGTQNSIGYFLHVPFPPPQVFTAVPEHGLLTEGLASYDLIGLQTSSDVANFLAFARLAVAGQLLQDGRLRLFDRLVGVRSFPVGIDPEPMAPKGVAESSDRASPLQIIGVDRLDYSKGLPEKLRAFGRFLDRHPEHERNVVLRQIAAPTRESLEAYTDIRQKLEGLTGAINGRHGRLDWIPVHYMNRHVPRDELPAVYREAAVALVTPLCDGMNLVAKEYVAAQDPFDPGVLVLSRFAGAADELREALIVNPYNADEVAEAIHLALGMPLAERQRRHVAMLETIRHNDAATWCRNFLQSLRSMRSVPTDRSSASPAVPFSGMPGADLSMTIGAH